MIHDPRNFDLPLEVPPFITLPPLASARLIPLAVPEGAIAELRDLRRSQIRDFGHTVANDLLLPRRHLPREAETICNHVLEDIQFDKPALARRHALKAASLLLAFVDAEDARANQTQPPL